tara:strand:- start:2071 stop:2820 length:750 start_codon:yes stop_codon:yes gene_type:complete
MRDFLQDCMEDFRRKAKLDTPVSPGDFRELFCSKCNNKECVNRQTGDPLSLRVATQFERLTKAQQADPLLPQYAQIVAKEWEDMTREALRLEIADRRGDWEVPDIDVNDGVPLAAGRGRTNVVDEAVRDLAEAQGKATPHLPEIPPDRDEFANEAADLPGELEGHPEEPEEPKEPEKAAPAPQHPKKNPTFRPGGRGNSEDQSGMIGGGPIPPSEKPADPWAVVPDKGGKKVEAGATIKFGTGGEIADE